MLCKTLIKHDRILILFYIKSNIFNVVSTSLMLCQKHVSNKLAQGQQKPWNAHKRLNGALHR